MRSLVLGLACCICALLFAAPVRAATALSDDFEDGDLATAAGAQGMSWTVVRGVASVATSGANHQMQLQTGSTLVVSQQTTDLREQTVLFKAQTTWSEPGKFVFLYKDASNYYAFGLGNQPGLLRRLAGVDTVLDPDANSRLRLPHAGAATNDFKVTVLRDAGKICLGIDRAGDGVDYDLELCDSDAAAVAAFAGPVAVGASVDSTPDGTRSKFFVDDVRVDDTRVVDPRPDRTFYVDGATGDDAHTIDEAQNAATPWKTLQHAADMAFSGDTVLVAAGLYRETVVPPNSGKAGRPITFKARDAANRPFLDGTSVPTGWQSVQATDFKGQTHSAWRTTLDAVPAAVFVGDTRMLAAQEPSQADPDDPYDLALFMAVPPAENPGTSHTDLVDAAFLTQPDGYWTGGTLLLYDGFPNTVVSGTITGFASATHTLTTEALTSFIGSDRSKDDKYAIRNHVGVLDAPGEYVIEGNAAPYTLTVLLPAGKDISTVSVTTRTTGFDFKPKKVEHLVVDGFDIRFFSSAAVNASANVDVTVKNSLLHHNQGDGLAATSSDGVTVESCRVFANLNNGVSFGYGKNYAVRRSDVTANGNNGIWVGSGTTSYFAAEHVVIQGNSITRHKGRRMHPDNFQMQQVRDIWLDGNLFVQDGDQNMWIQFCDEFRLTNNVFIGGTLGLNSTIHNFLFHNLFWKSSLRYDAHLTDAPIPGESAHYVPQQVVLRNNAFVESSIAWPDKAVVDRFAVFTVDHGYFNIENAWSRSSWEWAGYRLGVLPGGAVVATEPSGMGAGYTYSVRATVVWSHPGKLLVGYKDAQNHYAIGLGNQPGIYRVLGGTATLLYDDASSKIRLPHAGAAAARFAIEVSRSAAGIRIRVARDRTDGQFDVDVTDGDAAALAAFTDCGTVGALSAATSGTTAGMYLDDVSLTVGTSTFGDGFEDGDYTSADGATGLAWTTTGAGATVQAAGGMGIGFGDGSVVETDPSLLAAAFVKLPDAAYSSFDFHLLPGSPLRDHGLLEASVTTDFEGQPRFMGSAVDIGPFEYTDAPPRPPDAGMPDGQVVDDIDGAAQVDASAEVDGSIATLADAAGGADAGTGGDAAIRPDGGIGAEETGCSCGVPGSGSRGFPAAAGALLLWLASSRRRRR